MTKPLEEVAKALEQCGRKEAAWDLFMDWIAEGVIAEHKFNEMLIRNLARWAKNTEEANTLWVESFGRLPMTKEEKRQAFLDYGMEEHDVAQDG